jgi:hypothetical protein
MIEIENNVPIPSQRPDSKYPIRALEVGQSFLALDANPHSVRVIACRLGRDLGRKFKTMKLHGGVRVWRLS